jgi:ankyrin repeat protein
MGKELSPLLMDAALFVHKKYLSKPYTDIFEQEHLRHYNTLAQIQFEQGVVHRPNHNIVHTLRSLGYVRYIVDLLLNYGIPSLQAQLISMKNNGTLESFCQKIELASLFKVAGRESEVSRPDSVELYTRYRIKSAQAFRDYVDNSPQGLQLFSTNDERDFYQKKVVEDLGNPENKELPQLILRLAHDLDLQRCRSDEAMRSLHKMYDSQYLQSGYSFESLWLFAKSCIHETGGSVIAGYNERLYHFTEDLLACWNLLSAKDPYADPLYRNSVKGNLNLSKLSRTIRKGNAIARVVALPEIELRMLCDPRHERPLIETTKDRTLYTDQTKDKTGNIKSIKRSPKPYKAIEQQPVVLSTTFNLEHCRDIDGTLLPRSISADTDRGKPKETPYSKKMATSLVHTDGSYTPYADNRLGYLYDDAFLHHKGDRYIWPKNAGTITKPWLNGLLTHGITKSALQTHMRINTNDKINNELLRGLSLHALHALFYPYKSPERINLFYEYLFARDYRHNFPRIPLILWDYTQGDIYFYDINLIRSDLTKSIENGVLSAGRLQKICSILGVAQSSGIPAEQLASTLVEQFVTWEYYPCIDPSAKAKELLFQQVVSVLEHMKSPQELESLGVFCKASGTIFQQPVQLNCDSAHVVNLHSMADDCADTMCPICKQSITEITRADVVIDKMYAAVAELIHTKGMREILTHTACKMSMNSVQALFNRSDECPPDLLSLVARNLAERAIKQGNLPLLSQLINQKHLKNPICTSSKLLYLAALHSKPMLLCLMQYGADINGCDDDRGTALHYAAFDDANTAIQRLLEQGAKPNALNKDKLTALHTAAQFGKVAAVETLLSTASIEADLVNPCGGYTPFLTAVKYGHHLVVEKLIGRSNLEHVNDVGDSALHIAAEYGYEDVVSVLLANGANAHYKDRSGAPPMFRAAAYGREKALLLLLKGNTQHIDRQNKLGDTALHLAVKFARIATVKILLAHNADMELFNSDGESPLHLAIKFNRQNIICELMQHGADYTCKNKCGETPLMLAQKNFDKSVLTCFMAEQQKREALVLAAKLLS